MASREECREVVSSASRGKELVREGKSKGAKIHSEKEVHKDAEKIWEEKYGNLCGGEKRGGEF